ncbi:Glycosyl hydrolases 36 [Dillenia turbinata]|uniref:Glycosyl hydrolases 36 n=1 Tax=Dillenia turbinata TaxID=194707 RepID=A0AAN8ZPW4_9MAGN
MTVTPKISINDGNLVVQGKTILTGVPDNIVLTPGSDVGHVAGAFIGAFASDSKSLHGSSIYVSVPIQAMVDDSKNGHMWERCSPGDPIHARGEQGQH